MGRPPKKEKIVDPPLEVRGRARLLKAGNGLLKPDVWIVDGAESSTVWKTWNRRPGIERKTLGRWLAGREGRIMKKLAGLDGVPVFVGHPHPWTLEMTLLEAEPIPEVKNAGDLNETYFERLWLMLTAMHEQGIIHGDLRRKNLLRAPGDSSTPRLVDFTQCAHFREPRRGLRLSMFNGLRRVDRVTFLKLKKWYLGRENMSAGELEELSQIPWHLKLGRFFRKQIYRPLRRSMTGKNR